MRAAYAPTAAPYSFAFWFWVFFWGGVSYLCSQEGWSQAHGLSGNGEVNIVTEVGNMFIVGSPLY